MSNELPKLEKAVTIAEQVTADLLTKRSIAVARIDEIAIARKKIGFAVHANADKDARDQLDALNREDMALAGEIQSLDGALVEARDRLQLAMTAVAREQERESALALRGTLKELAAVGKDADAALAALIKASDRLRTVTDKIHGYGVNHPNHDQVFTFGSRAINTALMQTIWTRAFEVMAPGERVTFGGIVNKWIANLDASITHRLAALNNSKDQEAA
jgi:hypothetical protein